MRVIPLVWPQVDYPSFISEVTALLGRSPTRSLDEAGLTCDDLKGFLQALGEFQNFGTAPIPYLRSRQCDRALELISVAFLIETTQTGLLDLLKLGRVHVLSSEHTISIISGSFRIWRDLLIEGCTIRSSFDLRELLTEIMKHFVHGRFSELFGDYDILALRDRTLTLVRK